MLGGYLMAAFFLVGAPAALVVRGRIGPARCACAVQAHLLASTGDAAAWSAPASVIKHHHGVSAV